MCDSPQRAGPKTAPRVGLGRRLRGYIAKHLGILPEFTLACDGSLANMGWRRSWLSRRSEDAQGHPLPWITYPCLRLLEQRVPANAVVFEFGAGAGTLWWAGRVARIVACEHDPRWAAMVVAQVPANARIITATDGPDYEGCVVTAGGPFDIVVIDGIRREQCMHSALKSLTARGVLVWDNAEREDARDGSRHLTALGWRSVPFSGLGPVNTYESCTTIWYRDGNVLGL